MMQQQMKLDPTIRMIVFDKDGTLGDCTLSLHHWCAKMTRCIINDFNVNHTYEQREKLSGTVDKFHSAIGWDNNNNCLLPSAPLSAGTWGEILDLTTQALLESGTIPNAVEKVKSWHENLGDIHSDDKALIPDLKGYMEHLKANGFLISICTSDDRRATNDCIKAWGLEQVVDFSLCGDEVLESKPSAHPLHVLCKQANVLPENCVVVGDTSADIGMGRNGNAKLIVGVLTGSGTREHLLENGAHLVLPDISFLNQYLFVENHEIVPNVEKVELDTGIISRVKAS